MRNSRISRRSVRFAVLAAVSCALVFVSGSREAVKAAAPLTVRTVPWKGDPTAGHPVYPGGTLILQGVATLGVTDTPAPPPLTATWDPGDGTPIVPVVVTNALAIELSHAYAGADGTPYTATLTVSNGTETASATFRVIVRTKTLDIERDMAIDKGLWYLWKNNSKTTVAPGVNAAFWSFGGTSAATSSAVQAFEINNHREDKDPTVDPYVHLVARGLAWLESLMVVQGIGMQPAGNPDTNGNGIALYFNDNSSNYLVGQVVDAFVASGTPGAVAAAGVAPQVRGRTYKDLVQDMMDFSYWGQAEAGCGAPRGSWYYTPNVCAPDNSTSQWPAIGGIAAERVWGLAPPAFVQTENLFWLHTSQFLNPASTSDGQFGYNSSTYCPWSDCQATTPSGLVQFIYDGVGYDHDPGDPPPAAGTDSENFLRGVQHIARKTRQYNNWPGGALPGSGSDVTFGGQNYYALYAITKTMRLAIDASGNPSPITMIDDNPSAGLPAFDWYRSDPGGAGPTFQPYGMARSVVANQQVDGHWNGGGQWTNPLSTIYAVIILSPSLFELGPKAQCQATPDEIGSFGGNVNFTSTGTIEQNPDPTVTLTDYVWHFDDGSADTTGVSSTSHSYAGGSPTTFHATLTVKDSNGNTDTASCPVTRVDTNVKPTAKAGSNLTPPVDGEYLFCKGSTLILDGSGSTDPEDGTVSSYAWDVTAPLTFTPPDSTSAMFDASAVFEARAPGVYDIGLKVADSLGKTDSKFGHVTVKDATDPACNQPPVANPDTFSTNEDTTLTGNVRTNDTDDHGIASTTVILITGPSHGMLTLNADGSFTYTPDANYNGPDSFSYKLNDGQFDSNVATVSITVNSVDDAPIANDDAVTTNEDTPVSDNVLGNDSDVDNPVGMLTAALVTPPAHGVVSLAADGSFTYTPDADFNGTDSFTYQASDGEATSNVATVHITVIPVNDPPKAQNDTASGNEDTTITGNVLANDSDVDGDTLTASLGSGPTHGTVVLNADGTFAYTPSANYCGPDSFTYNAQDGHGGSTPAAVSITVTCVNDAPVANNDSAVTNEDTPVAGNVLTNDSDVDGDALTVSLVSNVSHGTLVLNANGTYIYTPALNYNGLDSFTYQVSDGHGGTAVATVTITVIPVNDAPVCSAVVPSISEIWPPNHQMVPVTLSGATDIEGDGVSFTVTGIYQDEPTNTVGDGNTPSDAAGVGTATAQVRAERSGTPRVPGNGRVYHIQFTGTDSQGGSCTGEVSVGVPHDQGNKSVLIDDGIKFNSVTGAAVP